MVIDEDTAPQGSSAKRPVPDIPGAFPYNKYHNAINNLNHEASYGHHEVTNNLNHDVPEGHHEGHHEAVKGHHEAVKGHHEAVKGHHEAVKGHHEANKGHHKATSAPVACEVPEVKSCPQISCSPPNVSLELFASEVDRIFFSATTPLLSLETLPKGEDQETKGPVEDEADSLRSSMISELHLISEHVSSGSEDSSGSSGEKSRLNSLTKWLKSPR